MTEPGVEHRRHKSLNNRAENSHQPIRWRERIMKRFMSPRQMQRFPSAHDQIANVFSRRRNQDTATRFQCRPRSSIHHLGRGHRRGDGRVITPVVSRHSTNRAFRYSIDDKLTVSRSWFTKKWAKAPAKWISRRESDCSARIHL